MRTSSRSNVGAESHEYGYIDDGGGTRRRGRSMTAGPIADGHHDDERKRGDEDCYNRHHRRRRSDGGSNRRGCAATGRAVSLGDDATGRGGGRGVDKEARTAAAVNNKAGSNRPTRRRSTTEEAKATALDEELRNSRRGRSITSRRSSLPPSPPPVGISFRDRWHRSRSGFSNKKTTKKKKDGIVWNEIKHPTKSSIDSQFLRTWAINNSRSRSCSTKKKKKKKNDGAPSKEKLSRSRSSSSNINNRRRRETTSLKPKHYRQLIVNKLLNSDIPLLLGKEERGDRLLSQRRRNKSVPARLGHRVTWWNNSATTNKEEKDSSTSDGSSTCEEEYSSQSSEERRRSSSNTILRRGSSTSTSNPHVTKSPSNGIPRRTPTSSLTPHGRTPNSSATPRRRGGRPMSRHELRVAVTPIAGEEEEKMRYQAQHRRLPYTSDEILSRRGRRRSTLDEGRMPPVPFLNNKQKHKQYHQGSDIECSRRRSMSMPPIYTRSQQQQSPQRHQQQQESTGPVIYCDSLRTSLVSSLASMDSGWVYQRTKAHRDTIKLIETEIEKRLMASKNRRSKFDLKHQQLLPQPLLQLDPVVVITCDDNKTNNDPISQMASVDSSWIYQREKSKRRCKRKDEKRHQILKEFLSTIEKTTTSKPLQVRRRASSCQPKLLTDGSSIPLSPRRDLIDVRSTVAVRQQEGEGPCVHISNEETPKKRKHEFDISHLLTKDERKIEGITTSTVPSNMDISGSDVKTRTTTSRTDGSSWDVRVPNPISSLPGSSYDRQLTNSTKTHSLQSVEIVSVEEEGHVKTTKTSPLMVSASDTRSSSWGGGYEAKPSTVCSSNKSVQSTCGSNALTLFGDNGTLRGHSKDGRSRDKPCLLDAKVSSEDVTDTSSSLDSSSSNMCHVRCVSPENKIISSVVENDHDVTPITNNSGKPYLTNKKFVVPPLHSEIRSKMPKHLSSYYEKEKKKAQHMDSLNESEISGLTPVALRCPPKPPPQNLLKYASRSSSVHKETKNENNNNGSTTDSTDETAGSKVGLYIDINTNYTSQLSELSSPARVPPMLVEALVERYRHLSSHTKKKRQSQPVPTMREQVSTMTMEMPSSHHSYPPRDHVHSSSCIREAGKDFPSKVLPPPPRDPMPGPPFVQSRYPHNNKTNTNDPSSNSRGWSSLQDLKPSINDQKKDKSRTQQLPRATTRQPMECETMHQSNDNRVRKVGSRDSPDGGGGMSPQQKRTGFSSWNGTTKNHAHGMIWVDSQGNPGRYSGKMENGVPHGVGVMTYSSDGLIAEGMWVHGRLLRNVT